MTSRKSDLDKHINYKNKKTQYVRFDCRFSNVEMQSLLKTDLSFKLYLQHDDICQSWSKQVMIKTLKNQIWFPKCFWQVMCIQPHISMHSSGHTNILKVPLEHRDLGFGSKNNLLKAHDCGGGGSCWEMEHFKSQTIPSWIGFKKQKTLRSVFMCVSVSAATITNFQEVKLWKVYFVFWPYPPTPNLPSPELIKKTAQRIWEHILLCKNPGESGA